MMSQSKLKRVIGKFGIAALAINGLIGAGIFALPAGAAAQTGNFSPWAFLICAVLMLLIVLCFAQLAMGFDHTGGPVAYAKRAFGDHIAFQTTWLLYIGRLTALAANTNAIVLYLSFFYDGFAQGFLHSFSIIFVLITLLWLNLRNAAQTMSIINIITAIKLLPLVLFVLLGFTYIDLDKVVAFNLDEVENLSGALLLLVYAYIGFEGAVIPAGESKEPKKMIAKALISTLLITAILYFCIQVVSISVLDNVAISSAPLADSAQVMVGSIGAAIIGIAAIVSISGNLSAIVFTAPRMTFALARQGNLPKWFASISEKTKTPQNSIIFLVVFAMILALTGSFIWLAIISSLARLIGYFITISALVKLKKELIQSQTQWILPLGLLIPLLALCVCLWLASAASWQSWLTTMAFCCCGSGLFWLTRPKTKNKKVE
ncbi:APC family permease [Thalassotalea sp. M1531]|uniref:APC family permease n=1 Tax=Thalassotalea algicola TaxID=2716224 RepID=A0A7Y0LBX2_9GAMM|nr:APC family permease [Thalassotalea algicola]NMP31394.1 APC family permease [Thalassotalea algicola]